MSSLDRDMVKETKSGDALVASEAGALGAAALGGGAGLGSLDQDDERAPHPSLETAPEAPRGAAGPEVVESIVRDLNALCRDATLTFTMEVGRLVVTKMYSGNLSRWRVDGAKEMSFRRLARHPDLPMSPSALCRCVAIYELWRRLGCPIWTHVCASHLRLVLPLPGERQVALLGSVEANGWTVRQLEREIRGGDHGANCRRQANGSNAPRERGVLRSTLRTLESCLDPAGAIAGAHDPEYEPTPESSRCICTLVGRLRDALDDLEHSMSVQGPDADAHGSDAAVARRSAVVSIEAQARQDERDVFAE